MHTSVIRCQDYDQTHLHFKEAQNLIQTQQSDFKEITY